MGQERTDADDEMVRQMERRRHARPERRLRTMARANERRRLCSFCYQPGDHPTAVYCRRNWNDAETWHLRSTHCRKAPTALTARCGGAPARGDTAQSICGASCDASESPARANLAKPCARHGTVRLVDAALSPGEQPVETTARRMVDQTPQCRKMAARTASSSKGLRRHSKIPSRIAVC
jgi:hypothetical protein